MRKMPILTMKTVSVLVCAVILSACGSSGGGSGRISSSSTNTRPAPSIPGVASPAVPSSVSMGNRVDVNSLGGKKEMVVGTVNGNENFTKIMFKGRLIDLLPPPNPSGMRPKTPDGWHSENGLLTQRDIYEGELLHMVFGRYSVDSGLDNALLVNGKVTEKNNLPTHTQTLTYNGAALYSHKDDGFQKFHKTDATFEVNFGQKRITGNINLKDRNDGKLRLEATIDGNAFYGKDKNGTVTRGHFYGPNAEEMGGTFHRGEKNAPELIGAFGAKQ